MKADYIHKDTKTCEPLITAIELSKENIKFYGNTEEEKNKNEMIYDLTLEVDRLNNIIKNLDKIIKAAIRKLRAAAKHYNLEGKNNAINHTLNILKEGK